jgi:hypothetical protein
MFPRRAVVLAVALVCAGTASARSADAVDAIVGTWRGASLCTDRRVAPACSDEVVIYDILRIAGRAGTVTVNADKVIDGKREPMGSLEFTFDAAHGRWSTDIETPRVRATWSLVVAGTSMTGTMVQLPVNAAVRRMTLTKDK